MANRTEEGTRCTVPLGSLFGVRIVVDWSFFMTLLIAQLTSLLAKTPSYSLLVFVLFGPVLLITVLLHEMGHVLMTSCLGGRVTLIRLWIAGGLGYPHEVPRKGAATDLLIAIAGPVMNLLQMAIWVGVYAMLEDGDLTNFERPLAYEDFQDATLREYGSILAQRAFHQNMMIVVGNTCLPMHNFDGERIMADLLMVCGVSTQSTAYIIAALGLVMGAGFTTWGALLIRQAVIGYAQFGYLYVVFGLLSIFSGYKLWGLAVDDRLLEDPLFGRACYRRHQASDDTTIASIT